MSMGEAGSHCWVMLHTSQLQLWGRQASTATLIAVQKLSMFACTYLSFRLGRVKFCTTSMSFLPGSFAPAAG